MLLINGRRVLGMLRLISICLIAISSDFFDNVLPKPVLSGGREDFTEEFLLECMSSCFGGASLLKFTTLSTILVPMTTGLSSSYPFIRDLLDAGTEQPLTAFPLGALPLDGEEDCLLGLAIGPFSIEDDLELAAPGLPREGEDLSGSVVLRLGGASKENPGISEGFQGPDLTVGEVPRDGAAIFDDVGLDFDTELAGRTDLGTELEGPNLVIELITGPELDTEAVAGFDLAIELVPGMEFVPVPDFMTEEERLAGAELACRFNGMDGLLVGVLGLDAGLLAGSMEDLVGVEDLPGVEDLG